MKKKKIDQYKKGTKLSKKKGPKTKKKIERLKIKLKYFYPKRTVLDENVLNNTFYVQFIDNWSFSLSKPNFVCEKKTIFITYSKVDSN